MTMCARSLPVLLAVFAPLAAARADEPQTPKRELQFEFSPELHARYEWALKPGVAEPNYVAVLKLNIPTGSMVAIPWMSFSDAGLKAAGRELLATPAGQSTSEQQKQYLGQIPLFFNPSKIDRNPVGPNYQTVDLWSPSEADARKMVAALMQWADAKARQKRSEAEETLAKYRVDLAKVEKEFSELDPKVTAQRAERNEMQKVMAYDAGDAARDILELDKALRAVAIDMAAIQAKMEAIKKIRERYNQQVMFDFLAQLSATQDVDMAGALARKNALEAERKKTVHFRDLSQQLDQDADRLRGLAGQRRRLLESIPRLEQTLSDPPPDMRPLEVEGKVTIYRTGGPSAKPPQTMPGVPMPAGGAPPTPGIAPK